MFGSFDAIDTVVVCTPGVPVGANCTLNVAQDIGATDVGADTTEKLVLAGNSDTEPILSAMLSGLHTCIVCVAVLPIAVSGNSVPSLLDGVVSPFDIDTGMPATTPLTCIACDCADTCTRKSSVVLIPDPSVSVTVTLPVAVPCVVPAVNLTGIANGVVDVAVPLNVIVDGLLVDNENDPSDDGDVLASDTCTV